MLVSVVPLRVVGGFRSAVGCVSDGCEDLAGGKRGMALRSLAGFCFGVGFHNLIRFKTSRRLAHPPHVCSFVPAIPSSARAIGCATE